MTDSGTGGFPGHDVWPQVAPAVLETVSALIVVLDPEGRILMFNAACERLTGYKLEEVQGQLCWGIFVPSAEQGPVQALHRELARGRYPNKYQHSWLTKTGDARLIAWDNTAVEGPDGAVIYVIKTGVDITERQRTEDLKIENEAFVRSILNTAVDGIIAIDVRGIIRSFSSSAERIFGYQAAEVIGQNVSMLMPSPYRESHDGYLKHYHDTGERRIIGIGRVVLGQRKDGTTFPMELSVGEMQVMGQKYFTGLVRDITSQQQYKRRVHELQAELGQVARVAVAGEMSAVMAHEINQPLAAIVNYLQTLRRLVSTESDPRVQDIVSKSVDQAQRVTAIIKRVREFTRRNTAEPAWENLPTIIEQAASLALIGGEDRDAEVRWEMSTDLPEVMVDRVQIQQVVVNLMRNAIEALEGRSRRQIRVKCARKDENYLQVSIADSGPGISDEIKGRLFLPLMTTKPQGTGIGLRICQTIIDAHGGEIEVTSPNRMGGATFSFTLPIKPNTTDSAP